MKRLGIEALYRRPKTLKPAPGHKIYPYLLRGKTITRRNQVWAMDITYIPMARGFVYLNAVVDWATRKVLAWRLSITLETEPCLEALREAMAKYGKPEIMNTPLIDCYTINCRARDQGSQFTSIDFIKALTDAGIKISMNGKGVWRDNVFVERLWRTIKYEEVYLRAYRLGLRGSRRDWAIPRVLQHPPTPFIAWWGHAPLSPMLRIVCRGKGSGMSQSAKADSGSGITGAEIHLSGSRKLFKPARPPLMGNALANTLNGNDAANTLTGLGGDDNLQGRAGADEINGGPGAHLLRGGADADTFVFATGDATGPGDRILDFEVDVDTIDLSATGLGFGDFTITGTTNATITYGTEIITVFGVSAAEMNEDQFDFGG